MDIRCLKRSFSAGQSGPASDCYTSLDEDFTTVKVDDVEADQPAVDAIVRAGVERYAWCKADASYTNDTTRHDDAAQDLDAGEGPSSQRQPEQFDDPRQEVPGAAGHPMIGEPIRTSGTTGRQFTPTP